MRRKPGLLIPLLILLFSGSALGQSALERAQSYIEQGDQLLEAGSEKEARKSYNDALLADRGNVEALRRFGRMAAAAEDWKEVGQRFGAVLDTEEDDLEAHYWIGIADRELGRARPPVVPMVLEWRRARQHFEAVLAVDSAYSDVLYQYALLRGYRGGHSRWMEAIDLAVAQHRLRPELPGGQSLLLGLYIRFLERWNGEEEMQWLRGRTDDMAQIALARMYWIARDTTRARETLLDCLDDTSENLAVPAFLMLARLDYQLGFSQRAERYYWEAVERIEGEADALFLFEDLKYLLTDSEYMSWKDLETGDAYKAFIRRFWTRRNPLAASPQNPRLEEHYRRLLEADRSFVYYGYRGWINNPDQLRIITMPAVHALNDRYNDKGLVYIRHGQPTESIRTADEIQNESWRYAGASRKEDLIFHFLVEQQTGGPGNWRLAAQLPTRNIVADRALWDTRFQTMANAIGDPERELELGLMILEMADVAVKDVETGLQTDRHSWAATPVQLPFYYRTFTSRGDGEGTKIEVFYMMPLASVPLEDGPIELETGVAFFDSDWEEVVRHSRTDRYDLTSNRSDLVMGAYVFTVPPDSYSVAVHAEIKNTPALAGWKIDMAVEDFSRTDLAMSDLLAAFSVRPAEEGDRFVRDGQQVLPNAAGAFSVDQPVWIHFEVYNLAFGVDDKASFSATYTLQPEEGRHRGLGRLFRRGSRPVLSVQFDRDAISTSTVEQGMLDVSNVDPGGYSLQVTITDHISRQSATRSLPIELLPIR